MLRFFSDSIVSRVIARVLVIALLFNNLIFPTRSLALTGGAIQEEFTAFEPAGASEMVNLFTGDFTYNIPLLDVDGYPVNIAYHSNPGIDEEASWVGLGWSLNAGAVNRSVRGIPDDFKKDEIKRQVHMKESNSWGVSVGGGVEFSGKGPSNAALSAGAGAVYNNYKGLGYDFYTDITGALSSAKQEGLSGKFDAGLGIRVNSQEGTSFYAQGGISGNYLKTVPEGHRTSFGVGLNIGTSSNSRNGRDSWSLGAYATFKRGSSTRNNSGGGVGIRRSVVTPLGSIAYTPKLEFDMNAKIFSYDIKGGFATCNVFAYGGIRGYHSQSSIASEDISYNSYGYLYEESSLGDNREKTLLDYSRDKDGTFYAETPNAAFAKHTFDFYSATGQGISGAFHLNRNDIGVVYDPKVKTSSNQTAVGGEFGAGPDGVNVGANVNDVNVDVESGLWKSSDNNKLDNYIGFKTTDLLSTANNKNTFEQAYFKFSGEKTFDNNLFNAQVGFEQPVRPALEKINSKNFKTGIGNLEYGYNSPVAANIPNSTTVKTERNNKQNLISYLNVYEASNYGVEKNLKNYPLNGSYLSPTNLSRAQVANKNHHISELSILQTNGSRYVYGIPIYNLKQKDVSFRANSSSSYGNGILTYNSGDNSTANGQGIDNFFESTETPEFVHTHLLTSILSDDYVDRGNDGVTDDDLGGFTKFNYTKMPNVYKWRMPVSSSANSAYFGQGMYADEKDQSGSYTYGEKNVWYMHSIETKNYIAQFIVDDRLDALPVTDENGAVNSSNKLKKLSQIKLYSKPKYDNDPPTLLKTVNFEYDYSLCPNTPNSSAGNKGKLTLKKIWFTVGTSNKGIANPYKFFYADPNHLATPASASAVIDQGYNPGYNYNYIDRWGQYKDPANNPGSMNNLEYPYCVQSSGANNINNYGSSVWNLNTIFTPSGSKLSVDFESDDYNFVNEKRAGQMFKIKGFSPLKTGTAGTALYSHPAGTANTINNNSYLHIVLDDQGGGIPANEPNKPKYFIDHYLRGDNQIYFKCKVRLDNNKLTSEEYIPGYAEVDLNDISIHPVTGDVVIKLIDVPIGDKQSGLNINPVAKAALQLGRMYVPKVMFPGSEPLGSNDVEKIKNLVTAIGDMKTMIKGVNKTLALNWFCSNANVNKSFVRLYNTSGKKYGGGSRVKQIKMSDNWNTFTSGNESASEYGQVFDYTKEDSDKKIISSGVASYEPLVGGDENSNRVPIKFSLKASASLNNSFFAEEPYCESFYPGAVVGYSKVTVKNLQYANIKKNATGRIEHEFFTTVDFPTKEERTPLNLQPVKPKILPQLFKIRVESKVYLSQGFVIKTNDMHGKVKSVKNFAEGQDAPISGITYNYKSNTNSKELDNKVTVLGPDKIKTQQELGVEIDVVNDSRSSKQEIEAYSAMANVCTFSCSFWIPIVFFWPGYSKQYSEYYCSTITKTVQKFGILESVEAFDNNSHVLTKNLVYDKETGGVILTSTNNQFDKDVFSFDYPAYWAYDGMGSAYKNQGTKFFNIANVATNVTSNCGQITMANAANYFVPGDEVVVYDALPVPPANTKYVENTYRGTCWVIKDLSTGSPTNGQLFLIDKDGYRASTTNIFTAGNNYIYKINRSGRRNLQGNSIGSITSLTDPIAGNGAVYINSNVLSASAVEYDDKWNMLCEKCTPTQITTNLTNSQTYQQFSCQSDSYGFFNQVYGNLMNVFSYAPAAQTLFSGANNGNPISLKVNPWLTGGAFNVRYFMRNCNSCTSGYNPPAVYQSTQYTDYDWVTPTYSNLTTKNTIKLEFESFIYYNWYNLAGKKKGECGPDSRKCEYIMTLDNPAFGWNQATALTSFNPAGTTNPSNSFEGFVTIGGNPAHFTGYINNCPCYPQIANCSVNNVPPEVDNCLLNPFTNGLRGNWRPKRSFTYFTSRDQLTNNQGSGAQMNGDIAKDGTYSNFVPFWYYQGNTILPNTVNPQKNTSPYNKWVKGSEVDKIDWFGNAYQTRDALDKPSVTLYGYNNSLPIAVATNAYQNEILCDGFEDKLSDNWANANTECNRKFGINNAGDPLWSHTGNKSLFVLRNTKATLTGRFTDFNSSTSNSTSADVYGARPSVSKGIYIAKPGDNIESFGPFSPLNRPSFVVSVWVHVPIFTIVTNFPNVGIAFYVNHSGNGNYISCSVSKIEKSPIINGWQKIDYYYNNINSYGGTVAKYKLELYNNNIYNDAYYDDLRIQPFNSTLVSKVYNPKTMQLMAELDDKNFATYYEYDEDLTMVRVKKETEKGVFTIKETRTGLKK